MQDPIRDKVRKLRALTMLASNTTKLRSMGNALYDLGQEDHGRELFNIAERVDSAVRVMDVPELRIRHQFDNPQTEASRYVMPVLADE